MVARWSLRTRSRSCERLASVCHWHDYPDLELLPGRNEFGASVWSPSRAAPRRGAMFLIDTQLPAKLGPVSWMWRSTSCDTSQLPDGNRPTDAALAAWPINKAGYGHEGP